MKGFHAGGSKPRGMGPDFVAGGLAAGLLGTRRKQAGKEAGPRGDDGAHRSRSQRKGGRFRVWMRSEGRPNISTDWGGA